MKKFYFIALILFCGLCAAQSEEMFISVRSNLAGFSRPWNINNEYGYTTSGSGLLFGADYNYLLLKNLTLFGGVDFNSSAINYSFASENKLVNFASVNISAGVDYNLSFISLFGRIGASVWGKQITGLGISKLFNKGEFYKNNFGEFGIKHNVISNFAISLSLVSSLSKNIKILPDMKTGFYGVNIGVTYSFIPIKPKILKVIDEDKISGLVKEHDLQIKAKYDSLNSAKRTANEKLLIKLDSLQSEINSYKKVKTAEISIPDINRTNFLSFYEDLDINEFVKNDRLTEKAKITMREYSSFCEQFSQNNLSDFLYITCSVPANYFPLFQNIGAGKISFKIYKGKPDKVCFEIDQLKIRNEKNINLTINK